MATLSMPNSVLMGDNATGSVPHRADLPAPAARIGDAAHTSLKHLGVRRREHCTPPEDAQSP